VQAKEEEVKPQLVDATRRTRLAGERTQLAWWRTGLTALAVAIAIGRVVPDLGDSSVQWPFTVVGALFALYGVALMVYGTVRLRAVEKALARDEYASPPDRMLAGLTFAGACLGLATVVLILID
jgi:inner membrane protein YidH